MRIRLILIFVALCAVAQETPPRDPRRVTALPAACSVGQTVFLTTGTTGTYECRTTNTWSRVADGGAANTATNISGGTAGQFPYQTGPGATGFRTPNVANGPVVLDANGNAVIGTTCPAGAPTGSVCVNGVALAAVISLPAAATNAGTILRYTHDSAVGACSGSGSAETICHSDGVTWLPVGGGISSRTITQSWTAVERFTIDHTKVGSSSSTNFPLLIYGTYSWAATVANGGSVQNSTTCGPDSHACPADLAFYLDTACTNKIQGAAVIYWAGTAGKIEARVNVPTVSSSSNTSVYACVGSAAITAYQHIYSGAFDSYYRGIYAFANGSSLDAHDASQMASDGTLTGTPAPTATAGIVGVGAMSFPAANGTAYDNITATQLNPGTSDFTLSMWFNLAANANNQVLYTKTDNSSPFPGYGLILLAAGNLQFNVQSNNGTAAFAVKTNTTYNDGANHRVSVTVVRANSIATAIKIYVDGVSVALTTVTNNGNITASITTTNAVHVGAQRDTSLVGWIQSGTIDDVSFALTARSADWQTAIYNNESSPSTFYAVAALGAPTAKSFTLGTNNVVYASQIAGVVLDCANIAAGTTAAGGTCTDNGPAFSAVMMSATSGAPLRLIIDKPSGISTITVPTGVSWSIECTEGSGLFVLNGSNNHAISNIAPGQGSGWWSYVNGGVPTGWTPPAAPTPAGAVSIKGCFINANRAGNATGTNTQYTPGGAWVFGIYLAHYSSVALDNVYVLNPPTFGIQTSNVSTVVITNSTIEDAYSGGHNVLTDGFHLSGPIGSAVLRGNKCITLGDDCIAVNAPEDWGGNIGPVGLSNIQLANSLRVLRTYGYNNQGPTGPFTVGPVVGDNITGTTQSRADGSFTACGFFLGNTTVPGRTTEMQPSIQLSNVRITAPRLLRFAGEPMGNVSIQGEWVPLLENSAAHPAFDFVTAATVNQFSWNVTINRELDTNTGWSLLQIPSGATINRANSWSTQIINALGTSPSNLASLIDVPSGGALGRLFVASLDMTNATATLSAAGSTQISAIKGAVGANAGNDLSVK